jgi:predicted metalloenzyme YecM
MRAKSNLRTRIFQTRYAKIRTFRKLTGLEHVFKLRQQLKRAKKDVRILKKEQKQLRKTTRKIRRETRRLQELNNQMSIDLEVKTEELKMMRVRQKMELEMLRESVSQTLLEIREKRQAGGKVKFFVEIKLQVV